MPDSKYFGIPFGTSGDKATIPEATQPSGAISFQQGFGPDYERDPATDPLAKRIPRDETNELYFQITNTLRFLQLYGLPEWYAVDGSGTPVSYPIAARVRHANAAWVSIAATNTAQPGTDATKWMPDTAFDLPTLEASAAEALAATLGTRIITPRRMAPAVQRAAWIYGTAGGTANALTLTLAPALTAYSPGQPVRLLVAATNTAAATINVNGVGAKPILGIYGSPTVAGDLTAGQTVDLVYNQALDAFVMDLTPSVIRDLVRGAPPSYVSFLSPNITLVNNVVSAVPLAGANAKLSGGSVLGASTITIGPTDGGLWQMNMSTYVLDSNAGGSVGSYIRVNGTNVAVAAAIRDVGLAYDRAANASIAIPLVAGDVVSFFAGQSNMGATRKMDLVSCSAARLGAS